MSQAIETSTIIVPASETPPHASVNLLPPSPVTVMVAILRTMGTDLANEREAICVLMGAGFKGSLIVKLLSEVIASTRRQMS